MTALQDKPASLQQLLGKERQGRWAGYRVLITLLVTVLLAGLAYVVMGRHGQPAQSLYKTEKALVDTLVVKVSATGNLQPTNQVDVGSETSGIVEEVLVEENDRVKKGQLLARLDLSRLQDVVTRSQANLAVAEAQVLQANATIVEARATLERLREVEKLSGGKVPSKGEMVTAEATLKRAEAAAASARAGVTQAQANLKSDQTSLAKGYIRAPIDGVVLTRSIEPGQTMAVNFQAPVLFTLAEDLTKMELQVAIDEADVGQISIGQQAVFSVDAWPGRQYPASITGIGYGSQEEEGVVSYPATLVVDNSDLSLRPGMTATAEITTLVREKTLLVPNAALRFSPPVADASTGKKSGGMTFSLMPRPQPGLARSTAKALNNNGRQQVWILRNGQPVAVPVKAGASNGHYTEILSGELQPGVEVITEMENAQP
jgi:HlyD family secretion protein